jgi:two-component system, cell cycle sensor histidine kinase and response regulator CckA
MPPTIKILLAEDSEVDAELIMRQLRRADFRAEVRHVSTKASFIEALRDPPDVILSDYNMGSFDGFQALEIAHAQIPELPLILVSGTIGEELAVEAIKKGAADYLMKDRLMRLESAITHALAERRARMRRKQAEIELHESERFVRATLNALTAHIAILDEHGVIVAVNQAWRTFAAGNGMPAGRGCEGADYLQVCDTTLDKELAGARTIGGALRDVLSGRLDFFEGEYPCHAVNTQRWFVVRVTVVPGDGPRRVVVAHENITTRKMQEEALRMSEERFRQLAENIHEVFWMTDPGTHAVLYVSPAYETIWGRPRADLYLRPAEWLDAIHPADRARVEGKMSQTTEVGKQEVYRVVQPDGAIRWVRDRAFPIRDAAGRIYRIVGTAEDITEHRKLEDQLAQSQKMEAIGTLAGGIAHDFNNILAAIMGYAELMSMQVKGQPRVEANLDSLRQASSRAAALVRQILTFSRKEEHSRQPVQLAHVLAEPLSLLRATLPAMIAFDIAVEKNLPSVLADMTQIHQVVMNLGTNAAHAMSGRAGRFGIKLDEVSLAPAQAAEIGGLKPGPHVRLTVSDTGRGMTPAVQARIFEPFFTTKALGEGTGLGLAVVHGVMQSHEGAVTVRSAPDQGTTFELFFPAHAEASQPEHTDAPPSTMPRGRGERVLFVDDEASITQIGVIILNELGYRVEGRTDVLAALELVRANPQDFDLVISDVTMPDMSGIEFVRCLQMLRPTLPIILITGYSAELTSERVKQIGVRGLLTKPFTLETLAESARHTLDAAQ